MKAASDMLAKAIATVLFIGYFPLIPGTFASVAGVGLFFLAGPSNSPAYFLIIFLVILAGLFTCGRVEKILNKKDPGCIVIDEIMGMLISLSFMPRDLRLIFIGFLFFRILDTLKPFPIGRIQHLRGALGVMGDDFIAAIYTNLLLQVVLNLSSLRAL